jgi:L-rhamnonate dehydratase
MKISKVETISLRGRGDQGSYGPPYGILVRVTTDTGVVGYGETDSMPAVIKAVIEAPFFNEMMSGLKWVLLDQDPLDIDGLWQRMARATLNYSRDGATLQAMAAVDLALWDIKGKVLKVPICDLLGGSRRSTLPCYATRPLGRNLIETSRFAHELCEAGFTAVKFGWHPLGPDADRDVAIVGALREAIGPDTALLIDGGLAWNVDSALDRLRRFEPYRLFWVEEPLRPYDFAGYAKLTQLATAPIAAGELASSFVELSRLIEDRCVHVLQVDVSRVGLTQAMRVAALAARYEIPCVNHSYSYGINLAASLHFAAAIERTSLFEYQATANEIRDVLVPDAPQPVASALTVPRGPGLGVEIDEDALRHFANVA